MQIAKLNFRRFYQALGLYTLQAVVVLLIAFFGLDLWEYEMDVPFQYSGDAIVILLYIKGLLDEGWPTVINHLSAPFAYPGAAFPMLTSTDWLVIKSFSFFTVNPGYLLNTFWLATLVFSSWSSFYSTYQLGVSRILSFVIGILYAFLPYAFLRNVAHLSLVYYLVPLLCLLAVNIMTQGQGVRNAEQAKRVGLLACLMQGFNYIYYSFFAVLIFVLASVIGWKKSYPIRYFRLPLIAISVVSLATIANLVPSFISNGENGPPPEMNYKYTAESEIYGAKIRKMVAPHPENFVPFISKYAKKDADANFPNENENVSARLGLFGALGLFLSMLIVLRRKSNNLDDQVLFSVASLGIATLLVITVGGLGAIINIITVPDIRGYNRYSVFLSFFVMTALALQGSKMVSRWPRKKAWTLSIIILFSLFSLYDQLLDRRGLLLSQSADIERAHVERQVVETLERELPRGAKVLQLPFTGYPPLEKFHNMESYDHARPYLWSRYLNWSWPSFSIRHRTWQNRMSYKHGDDLIQSAILSGFSAIWIDQAAYADNGSQIIESLTRDNVTKIPLPSKRFTVLDLRAETERLHTSMGQTKFDQLSSEVLGSSLLIDWGRGVYGEERSGTDQSLFRWSSDRSHFYVMNIGDEKVKACVELTLASPHEGTVQIHSDSTNLSVVTSLSENKVSFPLMLLPKKSVKVTLNAQMKRFDAPGDGRSLYFYIKNYKVNQYSNGMSCGYERE